MTTTTEAATIASTVGDIIGAADDLEGAGAAEVDLDAAVLAIALVLAELHVGADGHAELGVREGGEPPEHGVIFKQAKERRRQLAVVVDHRARR